MSQRKARLEGRLGSFMRQYARKKEHGQDPNDRKYDQKLKREIRRMNPAELDELLRGEDSEEGRG
jgi:hypothetical protein